MASEIESQRGQKVFPDPSSGQCHMYSKDKVLKSDCKARIWLRNSTNTVVRYVGAHTHEPNAASIEVRLATTRMRICNMVV